MTLPVSRLISAKRFPKERRLLKRPEFLRAQKHGVGVRGPDFVLLLYRRPADEGIALARLGIIASRKAGNAVHRNRCKRRIREWFRLYGEPLPQRTDIVVIVRSGMSEVRSADLRRQLDKALARAQRKVQRKHGETGKAGGGA